MAPTVDYLGDNDYQDFMEKKSDEIRNKVGLYSNGFLQVLRARGGYISRENYSKMLLLDEFQRNVYFVNLLLNPPFLLLDLKKVENLIELCDPKRKGREHPRPDLQKVLEKWRDIMKPKIESYKTYESFVKQLEDKYCESLELDEPLLDGLKAEDDDGKRCLTEEIVEQIKEETRRKDKNELFFKFLRDDHYGAQVPFLQFVATLKKFTKNGRHPIALAFETYYELRRDRKELKSQGLIEQVFKVTQEKAGPGIKSQAAGDSTSSEPSNFIPQSPTEVKTGTFANKCLKSLKLDSWNKNRWNLHLLKNKDEFNKTGAIRKELVNKLSEKKYINHEEEVQLKDRLYGSNLLRVLLNLTPTKEQVEDFATIFESNGSRLLALVMNRFNKNGPYFAAMMTQQLEISKLVNDVDKVVKQLVDNEFFTVTDKVKFNQVSNKAIQKKKLVQVLALKDIDDELPDIITLLEDAEETAFVNAIHVCLL